MRGSRSDFFQVKIPAVEARWQGAPGPTPNCRRLAQISKPCCKRCVTASCARPLDASTLSRTSIRESVNEVTALLRRAAKSIQRSSTPVSPGGSRCTGIFSLSLATIVWISRVSPDYVYKSLRLIAGNLAVPTYLASSSSRAEPLASFLIPSTFTSTSLGSDSRRLSQLPSCLPKLALVRQSQLISHCSRRVSLDHALPFFVFLRCRHR